MSISSSPPSRYDRPSSPSSSSNPSRPQDVSSSRPRFRPKPSIIDELLPIPSITTAFPSHSNIHSIHVLRRLGSLTVVIVFLLSVVFLASTKDGTQGSTTQGLRKVFGTGSDAGVGGAGWVAQGLDEATGPSATADQAAPTGSLGGTESGRASLGMCLCTDSNLFFHECRF